MIYEKQTKKARNNNDPNGVVGSLNPGTFEYGYVPVSKRAPAYLCKEMKQDWGIGHFTVAGAYTIAVGASALIAAVLL